MVEIEDLKKSILKYRKDIIKGYSKRHFCGLYSAEVKVDGHINELLQSLKMA